MSNSCSTEFWFGQVLRLGEEEVRAVRCAAGEQQDTGVFISTTCGTDEDRRLDLHARSAHEETAEAALLQEAN